MKEGKPTYFAEVCAAWRAAASMKPADERVCYEPPAKYFLRTPFRIISTSRILARIAFWYSDRKFPSASGELLACTRYTDEYLKACIDDGIEQLVILAAGYDTGAYRFDGLKGSVKVYEVKWRHSGFNVFCGRRIHPKEEEAMENLARYIIRASFSQQRMTYIPEESKVTYRSKDDKKDKEFDALEWLAAMCSHVPDKGEQLVRYYGHYSNASRGKRKMQNEDELIPFAVLTAREE